MTNKSHGFLSNKIFCFVNVNFRFFNVDIFTSTTLEVSRFSRRSLISSKLKLSWSIRTDYLSCNWLVSCLGSLKIFVLRKFFKISEPSTYSCKKCPTSWSCLINSATKWSNILFLKATYLSSLRTRRLVWMFIKMSLFWKSCYWLFYFSIKRRRVLRV